MENLGDSERESQSLKAYYQGENEPVADWFLVFYTNYLHAVAWRILEHEENVRDVLSEVALKLIELNVAERPIKFRVKNDNIKGALAMRVRNASYDFVKRKRPDLSGEIPENPDSQDLAIIMTNKDCVERLLHYLENNGMEKEAALLKLLETYGSGHLNEIAKEMEMTTEEVRVLQQRFKRNAKKFLINIGCGD